MSGEDDYYKILEIDRTASDDEIIKAYRSLSKKYHPDKNPDKKEWAEEKFKLINEAKNVLLDPDKKEVYDKFGKDGLRNGGGGGGPHMNFNGFNDIFSNIFGKQGNFQNVFNNFGAHFNNNNKKQVQQKIVNIPLTLEQVNKGFSQTKRMKIENECGKCQGTGKSEVQNCGPCNGSGMRMFVQQVGPGMIQQTTGPCNNCNKVGKIGKGDNCSDCNGSKHKEKIISIEVPFPAGVQNNIAYKYVEADTPNVEFIFIAQIESHDVYKRENGTNNLLLNKTINLYEALCGIEFNLKLLCGKEILVKSNKVIKPNTTYKLETLGIAGGDILIGFDIVFPDNIDEEGKNKLSEVLNSTVNTDVTKNPNTEVYYIK
jgi:DnaJ-class molecular chaperone